MITAPAHHGGAPARAPLQEFSVRVTLETGERREYSALASNSLAALENAMATYGICKIAVWPKLRRIK